MAQLPLLSVEVDLSNNAFDAQPVSATYVAGSVYVLNPTIAGQVTGLIRSLNIRRGKQSSLNRFEAGTATLVLDNRDGRFDLANPSSPYYSALTTERRIRIRCWYNRLTTDQARGTNTAGMAVLSNATVAVSTPASPRLSTFNAFTLTSSGAGVASGTALYTSIVGFPGIPPPWDITKGIPVTPGETITTVASYLTLGGITRSVTATIQWRNAAGGIVGTTVGTARSTGSVTWVDDSITTTVPSNAVYASVLYSWPASGASEQVRISCLGFWYGSDTTRNVNTLTPGQPITLNGTPQTTIWLFFGIADVFANDFVYNFDATVTISATDHFRRFQAFPTQDLYAMEVLSGVESGLYAFETTGYWRLNEPAGSRTASDSSSVGGGGTMYAMNGSNVTFGITPNTLTSSSNRSASFATVAGLSGWLQNLNPKILMTFNTTVTFWCLFNTGIMLANNCIVSTIDVGKTFAQGASTGVFIRDTSDTKGFLAVVTYSAAGVVGQTLSLNGNTLLADGIWHHVAIVFPPTNNGTFVAYVDGQLSGSSATVDGVFINPSPWSIGTGLSCIGGSSDGVSGCVGQLDEVGCIARALTASDVTLLYQTRTGTFSASGPSRTGVWISRLLTMIAWNLGYLQSDPGDFSLAPMDDLQGSSLLDVFNSRIMATEYGAFFIRADGQACFLSRSYVASNSQLSAIFSDVNDANYGVVNIPYKAIQRLRDEQFTYNDVVLSRHSGTTVESVSQSGTQFGRQTLTASTYDTDDGTLATKATWFLNHYQLPRTRFPRVAVDVSAYPATAGAVVSRELMDLAMVIQSPPGVATLQFTPTIIRIEHAIGPDSWAVNFVMDTLDSVVESISTSIAYAQLDSVTTAVLGTAQLA